MRMMYKETNQQEIVTLGYYNVLFYLRFKVGVDELKKNHLIARIKNGEKMNMSGIYRWCQNQHIAVTMRFFYRKDYSIRANAWNLYSYCRFRIEIWMG